MADGYQEIKKLDTIDGINELNRQLETLFKLVAGDGQNVRVYEGYATPEGQITAPVGALYLRKDGGASTTLYVKESGTDSTGWVAK